MLDRKSGPKILNHGKHREHREFQELGFDQKVAIDLSLLFSVHSVVSAVKDLDLRGMT
jgi:hypothetical protein